MTLLTFIRRCWRLVLFVGVLALILIATGCNPQKRLNRLLKNHPELSDTTWIERAVAVPGFTFSGSAPASTLTPGVDSIFSRYAGIIDSLTRRKLVQEIHNHITQRPCLDGPVHFKLPHGGTATLQQHQGKFYLQVNQPPQYIPTKVPAVIFHYQGKGWRELALAALVGFGLCAIFVIFIGRASKGGGNG